jgi:hypothetical protein
VIDWVQPPDPPGQGYVTFDMYSGGRDAEDLVLELCWFVQATLRLVPLPTFVSQLSVLSAVSPEGGCSLLNPQTGEFGFVIPQPQPPPPSAKN